MARQSKVLKHGLAELVLEGRRQGRSATQIADDCNEQLDGVDTLSKKAIERHLATLDKASVPDAHVPETAAANARLAVDVAARINQIDLVVARWLDEVEGAETVTVVGSGQDAYEVRSPDWTARTRVARELRQTQETVVNLLERVHNAAQIEIFQQEVLAAIRQADPETAKRVVAALQGRHATRRAALLG